MPGLIAVFDPQRRPDMSKRFERQERATRAGGTFRCERFTGQDGRVALGRVDHATFNPEVQPHRDAGGRFALVMQGEISDCAQRIAALEQRGIRVAGKDNAALLLATILADGLKGVEGLNGSFFFALWDSLTGTLTLGGDRHANRPHYYHQHEGRFYLAPDVKGILAARGDAPDACLAGISSFLAMEHPFADQTLFEGIKAFPGGTFLVLGERGLNWVPYWQPHYTAPDEKRSRPAVLWRDEAEHLMRQAIRRATAKNDFVLPLSGGSDSRTLAAFATHSDYPAFTFGSESSEDVRYARQVAEVLGLRHQVFSLSEDYMSRHAQALIHQGEGMVSLFHAHDMDILGRMAGLAPVVVYGMTAEYFRTEVVENVLATRPTTSLQRVGVFAQHVLEGRRPQARFAAEADFLEHLLGYYWGVITPSLARQVLSAELCEAMDRTMRTQFAAFFAGVPDGPNLDRLTSFNVGLRQRRFSQAGVKLGNGVAEYRKPFDDYDLVDFMLKLPAATRRRLQAEVLRHAAPALAAIPRTGTGVPIDASYLRRGVAFAGKEARKLMRSERLQSFANPQALLRGPSRDFYADLLLDSANLDPRFFNAGGVRKLLEDHLAGRVNAGAAICALATLELWRRSYAPGKPMREAA